MTDTQRFARAAIQLIVLGVLASWTAFGVYVYKFAPGQWFKLSEDANDWSAFGSYIGGVLGPFFGWLAFLGVLFTVVLQAKQMETAKHQASLEEMQRVAAGITNRIDDRLTRPPIPYSGVPSTPQLQVPLSDLISAYASWKLSPDHSEYIREATLTEKYNEFMRAAAVDLRATGLDFEALGWCLNKYRENGGSALVLEFYQYRYMATACWFDAIFDMKVHLQFQDFFKPVATRKTMETQPAA